MGGPDSGPWLSVLKGLRSGAGNAGSTFSWVPSQTPRMTASDPNPGSRAQNLGLGQMRSFLVILEGFTPNMTASGPNPWFWAQNHGFGPDVGHF